MKTIICVRRLGVNSLQLTLSDNTVRRIVTSRNEITRFEESALATRSRDYGLRVACAGIGRIMRVRCL